MNFLKNTKDYHIIKKSNLFDVNWFKNNYNLSEDINPIKYYLKYGIEKNLNPSKDFHTLWYLKEYNDVKNSRMNPFVHYIKHGISEHRLTRPLILENEDKFSLINQDYNPCFFKDCIEDIKKNEVNIAFFIKNDVENLLPTEYIRVVIPFYHLFLQKNFNPYFFNDFSKINLVDFKNIDIAIIQRDALTENEAHFLVDFCKTNNIKIIYEIDDDLISIDKNHPNYYEFVDKKKTIEYLVSCCDTVTVSTQHLKEKLSNLNTNIKVIKNSLNDMLTLKNNFKRSNVIKIGYMGTLTHKNDVKIIEDAINNVKKYFSKKGKQVIFETVGVSDEKIECSNPINIPFKYSKYPYFIRWLKQIIDWDVAIAPLENTQINQSKSEIKYLEYSSLELPGIYSNIGAYSQVIKNNETGILVNNSTEEWQYALIKLIENNNLRNQIVNDAQNDIKTNYSIESMIDSWESLLKNLLPDEKLVEFNKSSLQLLTNPLFNQDYQTIYHSQLFDENYYNVSNQNKIYHYLTIGVFKGLNPSNDFNTVEYIKNNDIAVSQVNPLVHFIEKFENKFKYNFLTEQNIDDICQILGKKVSIIIPVYNAYDETKKCIESVLKYSNYYELILINDKSTDKRVPELLNSYSEDSNVTIINNENNLGFVASVNVGLKNSSNDVILLNSDTIVTPNWLNKLKIAAYSDKRIATVTPFSNNAGVFSVPISNRNNFISKNLGLFGTSNIVEKASNHVYMRVPTGNGFCMYIKRKAINSLGYFDEKTFGRGYGEENDFCMRAIEKGWENIIDDSTYIFHDDSSSFGKEKQYLIQKHMDVLNKKYPTYSNEVNEFINSKKFKNMGKNIDNALKNEGFDKKRVLHINNSKKYLGIDENENYLFYVGEHLILYYLQNHNLFKIKEWQSNLIDEICFNIIINFSIDALYECNFSLEKSKFLIEYFK